MKTIWFDMDGTIANLYAVENWLDMLRTEDPTPYAIAQTMHNMSLLARYLNKAQNKGYRIGIISWLSKCSTPTYDEAVTLAKIGWLKKHLNSVKFDEINIVTYGTPKEQFMKDENDILFDDEEKNRVNWNGEAFEPYDIMRVLKGMVNND